MTMIALKPFPYGGGRYKAGDEVEPRSIRDTNLLRKCGWARDGETASVEPAVSVDEGDYEQAQTVRKGKYQRRDMKAED